MNCSVCFDTRTLVVTRSFLKKASVPFSEEYEMLTRLTQLHPTFTIDVKYAAPRRPQFMPSYDAMLSFIHRQDNAEELMKEFNEAKQMRRNAYMHVRHWFLTRFPEMEQARVRFPA